MSNTRKNRLLLEVLGFARTGQRKWHIHVNVAMSQPIRNASANGLSHEGLEDCLAAETASGIFY